MRSIQMIITRIPPYVPSFLLVDTYLLQYEELQKTQIMINYNTAGFNLKKSAIQLVLFTLILFVIHNLTIHNFFEAFDFYFDTWKIYVFHFVTVLGVIYLLYKRSKTKPKSVFYVFIALSTLKMLAAIIFLSPLFFSKEVDAIAPVFGFFIPYFLYLAVESVIALRILNAQN